ncbi:MAG: lysylphosphatidylglycerol synthase domain-containing protein [Bacteroidota bacterium]
MIRALKNTKLLKKKNLWINLLVFVLSYFVLFRFFNNFDYISCANFFKDTFYSINSLFFIALLFAMAFANWFLETIKWKRLISSIVDVSFVNAFKSILLGLFFSLFIPNRAGDFIGRVYSVDNAEKGKLSLATLIGSFAQLLITMLIGTVGFTYFLFNYSTSLPFLKLYGIIAITLLWILVLISFILYFKSSFFCVFFEKGKNKITIKISYWLEVLKVFSKIDLTIALVLSFLRYLVFSIQLLLVFRFVGVDVPSIDLYFFVAVYYFILTFIPTVVYTEIGVRGALSIYLFEILLFITASPMYDFQLSVSLAAVILWVVNIVIPSIFGSLYTNRYKFFKS